VKSANGGGREEGREEGRETAAEKGDSEDTVQKAVVFNHMQIASSSSSFLEKRHRKIGNPQSETKYFFSCLVRALFTSTGMRSSLSTHLRHWSGVISDTCGVCVCRTCAGQSLIFEFSLSLAHTLTHTHAGLLRCREGQLQLESYALFILGAYSFWA